MHPFAREYELMYRRLYPAVLAYCTRRLPPDEARDAAADAFLVAWRRFDELPAAPLPWLIRTASLTVRDNRRGADRRARLLGRAAGRPQPPSADLSELVSEQDRVRRALERLPALDREVLTLVAWDDLDAAAAASVLGCSVSALRVRLHRARRRFAASLDLVDPPVPGSSDAERLPSPKECV
jgi:RNA polymerase sigma factor (sigma-70 family)